MNSTHSDSPESQSTQPLAEPPKKFKGLILLAVLLAPAVVTTILASFKIGDLTTGWVLFASPVAGILSGVMLSVRCGGPMLVKILVALILTPALAAVCLFSCIMGCGWAGGGGV